MIRSSKLSLSCANTGKANLIDRFIDEFRRVLSIVVDELWEKENVGKFISHKDFSHVDTILSCRAMQSVTGHASAMIRGARSLSRRTKKQPVKPKTFDVCPELDYRFVKTDWNCATSFDGFLILGSLTKDRKKIVIPLKKTKHFNKFLNSGFTMTKGCRLSKRGVIFMFEKEVEQRKSGATIGIDVGIADTWTDSRGNRSTDVCHNHGWTLSKVLSRLTRRKKGSKGFKRAQDLRENFVNWSINKLDMSDVSDVKIENIKDMRRGRKCDRFRSHWPYSKIFSKITLRAEEIGVRVSKVDPRNTSRKCSSCDSVSVDNRKGKAFKCVSCGHMADADVNAAVNISSAEVLTPRRGNSNSSMKKSLL